MRKVDVNLRGCNPRDFKPVILILEKPVQSRARRELVERMQTPFVKSRDCRFRAPAGSLLKPYHGLISIKGHKGLPVCRRASVYYRYRDYTKFRPNGADVTHSGDVYGNMLRNY